ncbi:hypothetical protein IQ251_14970 [Saccharopolyspora sp. HNM0983]|uniref:ATP synthase protein I n=1 Tax=Saccharopolyspora montiporae TaxID=2781240 RepID=A0A929B9J2_9PSEU|nr:hypothetical protein [Saccharopolyspora sp. HNM0983]MBE9375754.1 hypothetical protein [Saccharopolyspora sp. HNM0983]
MSEASDPAPTRPAGDPAGGAAAAPGPHAAVIRTLAAAMLRTAVLPVSLVVVLAAVVASLFAGVPGLLGAVIAGAASSAAALFTLWLMRLTAGMAPMFVMGASLGGYFVKMFALLLVMTAVGGVPAVHRESLAFTFLVTVLVWATAQAVAFRRTKIPTIVPGS